MPGEDRISNTFKPSGSGLEKFFGRLEAEIMDIVWDNHPITIKRVLYFLNKRHSYAYTTVMTVMNRLSAKKILTRTKKSHSFVYSPAMGKKEYLETAVEEILSSLIADYREIADRTINRIRKASKKSAK